MRICQRHIDKLRIKQSEGLTILGDLVLRKHYLSSLLEIEFKVLIMAERARRLRDSR